MNVQEYRVALCAEKGVPFTYKVCFITIVDSLAEDFDFDSSRF